MTFKRSLNTYEGSGGQEYIEEKQVEEIAPTASEVNINPKLTIVKFDSRTEEVNFNKFLEYKCSQNHASDDTTAAPATTASATDERNSAQIMEASFAYGAGGVILIVFICFVFGFILRKAKEWRLSHRKINGKFVKVPENYEEVMKAEMEPEMAGNFGEYLTKRCLGNRENYAINKIEGQRAAYNCYNSNNYDYQSRYGQFKPVEGRKQRLEDWLEAQKIF